MALIPAYNEGERIIPVIQEAKKHLTVIVVDDGSTDQTGEFAKQAGAEVLTQVPNQGKGNALKRGFSHAKSEGYDGVLTLDADGQHDPTEITKFLSKWKETHAELIIGARDFSEMPPIRRLSNSFARRSFSWAMGREIRDNQSGYRLITNPIIDAMLASSETGFEFEVEMIAVCVEQDMKLDWVPIRTIYGDETSHISPLAHTLHFLRVVKSTRARMQAHRRRQRA
ncbi:MAG: glycosyltransferase family 2 protein [Candidatus Eisenbacteria bacterium]|uniref:Glycosyltransferase family 2 protein n=1 Tax=Eiseniibacteriota bacterium TaxID=2212470 RepID=A0A7Y2E9C9_UNCEI|nr:glycosyltransferase family 2 protein [Candidatus Eisenbacteria bacterium]